MRKLRVEHYKNKCIGDGSCAAIAPDHFELSGKKATLLNSNQTDKNVYTIEVDSDETTAKSLIEAGKACPVNAIRVIDIKKIKI